VTQALSASRRMTARPTVIIGEAWATQAAHMAGYQSVAMYLVSV
jgi:hypothetical protein